MSAPLPVDVRAQLATMYAANNNTITPQIVLDNSSTNTDPLYPQFEWDDATAANLYRLNQASKLIITYRYNW